ncbi:hypothetical protein COZ55_00420 [archaeon CG_4_8_14_3_um_filter_38_5]|nr:MAG: hypothetical protein AUJ50_03510 [Candidatus Aenigmarchaeota archaeon CG1_02_38_14]PIV69623.1 MAG: hypothetical protein COS07_00120 [Candidatus Aenigmarchaeota archaeon CG01_land_8_20_14_3_00_37_9]PIX44396.1 MAG: hypothetical protein COZ55_00420 [archaeon CG_4_8_14_3_um_filter_38_5]
MKDFFIFKPCKGEDSFKLAPQKKVDRAKLIQAILKEFSGKITADTSFITIIDIGKPRITITRKGEIIVREVKEEEVNELSGKLMRLI